MRKRALPLRLQPPGGEVPGEFRMRIVELAVEAGLIELLRGWVDPETGRRIIVDPSSGTSFLIPVDDERSASGIALVEP